jgi:hypothetical protein
LLRNLAVRWAAVLLTSAALLTPVVGAPADTDGSVVASAPAPQGDMIWG